MARARDPNRDKAYNLWKEHNGEITNREIANQLDIDEKKVAVWKSRDKWGQDNKDNVVQLKKSKTKNVVQQKNNKQQKKQRKQNSEKQEPLIDSDELTDKQRLFCIYHLKYFNATKAYQKAYGCAYSTAMVEGHRHLRNPKIAREIDRIKEEQMNELKLGAKDVLQKYIDIAFADATDFAKFGKKEVQAMGAFGPLEDEDGNPIMVEVNYVDFIDSSKIDGTIITEVKKGKDGVSVKLADKMKALEMLSKYFDLLSENDKKRLQEEKLKAEIEKIRLETKIDDINSSKTVIVTNEDEMRKVLEDESN
ncbi:terminase small subunit [Niallia circulans]|uniref:terminase small subunit n=1 Tax=Niallia circulans TaxID=1397 RepID=UPI00203E2AD1|nr:terminase small subunit [Niallia circulans]MCM2983866.1 terminase small subunit [Niallia circulans]